MTAKIYTKSGDTGFSKNLKGKRKLKSDIEFDVVGTLDELSATLGVLHSSKRKSIQKDIYSVQSDLLKIGAIISGYSKDTIWIKTRTIELEKLIDKLDIKNKPLKNFILPGGSFESAQLHLARTVCRRVERLFVRFLKKSKSDDVLISYINRLSDFLFVLARYYNNRGNKDIIWKS